MSSRCFLALAFFVAQEGCTSYYELAKEEVNRGMIPDEAAIRVILADSSVVESGPYRHAFVREPSNFIIGSGTDRVTRIPFAGKVPRSEIDSTRPMGANGRGSNQATHFIVWRKQKASLLFAEDDYLDITPENQPGLWCVGTVTANERIRLFKGRIDSSAIRRVETNRSENLEGPDVFALSLPMSGGTSRAQYKWANMGLGPLKAGRDKAAMLLSFSWLSKASLYSVRFTTTFPQIATPGASVGGPPLSVYELAAMYGIAVKSRFLAASVSAGISYAGGSEGSGFPEYKTVEFSSAGFPLDLELSLTPTSAVGVAVKFYSTFSSRKSWNGFAFCVQFGEL